MLSLWSLNQSESGKELGILSLFRQKRERRMGQPWHLSPTVDSPFRLHPNPFSALRPNRDVMHVPVVPLS